MICLGERAILTVDIGNTNIKLCRFEDGAVVWKDTIPTPEITFEYVREAFELSGACRVAVSSVVRPVNVFFEQGMLEAGAEEVLLIDPAASDIMPHELKTPKTTGADRYMAVYAAHAMHPKEPVIVIQAGTALVVNSVDKDGVFKGGFIMPGLEMWLDSLTSAAQLPYYPCTEVDWDNRVAGDCTRDAILGGAAAGLRGALKESVRLLSMTLGGGPVLLFTGGWGDKLTGSLPGDYHPDLVNLGLYLYAKNIGFI